MLAAIASQTFINIQTTFNKHRSSTKLSIDSIIIANEISQSFVFILLSKLFFTSFILVYSQWSKTYRNKIIFIFIFVEFERFFLVCGRCWFVLLAIVLHSIQFYYMYNGWYSASLPTHYSQTRRMHDVSWKFFFSFLDLTNDDLCKLLAANDGLQYIILLYLLPLCWSKCDLWFRLFS